MRERSFAYTRTVVCAYANGCEKASRSLRKSALIPVSLFRVPFLQLAKRQQQFCNPLLCFAHPGRYALACALLEGEAEGAVAAVAAFFGQLLGKDGLSGSDELLVAADEVVDSQVVDISVVRDALTGEIQAEIGTVGVNGHCQLLNGQVVLQVEFGLHAVNSQPSLDLGDVEFGDGRLKVEVEV